MPEPETPAPDARDREGSPPVATRLLLVRHAVTDQTGPVLSGRQPGIDLSPRGLEQATVLAERLAALPIAAIYASPIERTAQTAAVIAARHGLEVRELVGVIEADYGDWTGGRLVDLATTDEWRVVQRAPSRARFPNGETIRAMQGRVVDALEEVVDAHPGTVVVVVSHADPIKAAIAHFAGMALDLFQRLHVDPASVSVVEIGPGGARLLRVNDAGTVDGIAPDATGDTTDDATGAAPGEPEPAGAAEAATGAVPRG